MGDHHVRPAREADASAICRIYNQGIEDRLATLETELRTPEERRTVGIYEEQGQLDGQWVDTVVMERLL